MTSAGSGDRPLGLDGDEVDLLAHAAVGAAPVGRDVGPGGAGSEALVLVTGRDLVDVLAARALRREHLGDGTRQHLGGEPGGLGTLGVTDGVVPAQVELALARADVG